MSDEQIVIEVQDKVTSSISTKLNTIATSADRADASIGKLQSSLNALNVGSLNAVTAASANAARSINAATTATQSLANQQVAQAQASSAVAVATNKASISQQQLAKATAQTATAQTQTATASQRLSTAQQQTAAATSRVTTAQNQASISTLKLQQAQNNIAASSAKAAGGLSDFAKKLISLAIIVEVAKGVIKLADAYTVLQNKLQNVTSSQGQVENLTDALFDLANRTRAPVDETATAFTRFDRSLKNMGKSQEDTLRLTETVNKALVNSGATASESASALLQLSQAFNSGKLQGDEFRAVSENMPIVLDAVAKALNVPIEQVKQYGTQGKITANVLVKAFSLIQDQVDATFAKTTPTVGQSLQVLSNNAEHFFGVISKQTGLTAGIAKSIIDFANGIDTLTKAFSDVNSPLTQAYSELGQLLGLFADEATRIVIAFAESILEVAGNMLGLDNNLDDTTKTTAIFIAALNGVREIFKVILVVGANVGFVISVLALELKGLVDQMIAFASLDFDKFLSIRPQINADSAALRKGLDDFEKKVMDVGANPQVMQATKPKTPLRGTGPDNTTDTSGAKEAEKRAKAMQKVNTQLDDEIARMGMLKPLRDDQAKFDQINLELMQKKITLSPAEIQSIKERITAIREGNVVQAEMDKIYQDSIGPAQTYSATIKATKALVDQGAISQNDANKALNQAQEAYLNAVDPLRAFNKDLDDQEAILKKIGPAQEIAQQMQQIVNQQIANGTPLSEEMTASIQKRLEAIQQEKLVNQELNKIYDETTGAQNNLVAQQTALNMAFQQGMITLDQYNLKLNQVGLQLLNLKIQMGNGDINDMLTASLGKLVENYQGVATGLTNAFGDFFQSFTDGFADSVGKAVVESDNLGDALRSVAQQAVESLISALIKLGIQYAVNAALGETLAISGMAVQTTASVAAAAVTGAAWAAPAALVSLASFGANSIPAMAGITATNALTQATALMAGFEQGGYTGGGGKSDVAGVVHGQEFVFDAAATKRIGVDKLEQLRSGSMSASSGSGAVTGGPKVNVTIVNNSNNTTVKKTQETDNDGNVDMTVTIDSIENALAARMASGRGALNKATSKTFGVQNKPTGR